MKTHTTKGAKILEQVGDLESVIPIVRSHHERWAGGGYPDGLAGEAISRLARIVAVADCFDAMTSDRPYRMGMPAEVAFAEVEKQSGKQFDPELAAAFLRIREPHRAGDAIADQAASACSWRRCGWRRDAPCRVAVVAGAGRRAIP